MKRIPGVMEQIGHSQRAWRCDAVWTRESIDPSGSLTNPPTGCFVLKLVPEAEALDKQDGPRKV